MASNSYKGGMSAAQNRVYDILVEKGIFQAKDGFDSRAADALVFKGKAMLVSGDKVNRVYSLSERNKKIEDRKKKPADVYDSYDSLSIKERMKRSKVEAQRNFIPDRPKKKIERPAAVYSNTQYSDFIDFILKTY